jgi:hypothetical protein
VAKHAGALVHRAAAVVAAAVGGAGTLGGFHSRHSGCLSGQRLCQDLPTPPCYRWPLTILRLPPPPPPNAVFLLLLPFFQSCLLSSAFALLAAVHVAPHFRATPPHLYYVLYLTSCLPSSTVVHLFPFPQACPSQSMAPAIALALHPAPHPQSSLFP